MVSLGPVSSLFDFLTFFIMLFAFLPFVALNIREPLFQTAWFLESLITQTIVVFAIRTRKTPFWKSKPGRWLILSSIAIVVLGLIIPFTTLGEVYFEFVSPPIEFLGILAGLVVAYLAFVEVVKRWFYKKNAYRVEQTLVPKKRGLYLSRTARLVQDIVAVICLRVEDEITIDSLLEDLTRSLNYPINPDEVAQNLAHLRRTGLIGIDWHKRTIKRQGTVKEYVTRIVMTQAIWPLVYEDWIRINKAIQDRYGEVNTEYVELILRKER
jgi:membrane protein YdbS with pleckstrin-like domain